MSADISRAEPVEVDGANDFPERMILILYATETGTTQEVTDRIARECRRVQCRVCNIGSYPSEGLVSEPLVVFVVATTGSGTEPRAVTPL
ncbi:NADPH dependent diflavin oxidoreductase 1 [Imleria badia]|nr:NADPH dependent diflavin oxidoreductase 1 [Imleria badia]